MLPCGSPPDDRLRIIADRHPALLSETIAEVLTVSDLVLIPVRPSPNDLRAVGATGELTKRARRLMVFVVTQATQRARITAEAAILLSQYGTVAPVMIHSRVDYATWMTNGRTAGELDPDSRSGAEIAALWTSPKPFAHRSCGAVTAVPPLPRLLLPRMALRRSKLTPA